MTNQEIVDTYLQYKGKVRTNNGKRDNTLPLMPFFIMDTVYQIYCKDVKPIECRHEMKRFKTQWSKSYKQFNRDFFRAFNQEQTEYIVDLMDEFSDYIHTTIVMLKSAVVNSVTDDRDFEDKKTLASLLTCNVLCQAAQHLHRDMYRNSKMQGETNRQIAEVQQASYRFACYYPASKGVDLTASDKVMSMITVLCKKIVNFLNVKDKEQI